MIVLPLTEASFQLEGVDVPTVGIAKAHTRTGDCNLVKLHTTRVPPLLERAKFHVGLREEPGLFDHSADWSFLIREVFKLHDEHPDGSKHQQPINKALASRFAQ